MHNRPQSGTKEVSGDPKYQDSWSLMYNSQIFCLVARLSCGSKWEVPHNDAEMTLFCRTGPKEKVVIRVTLIQTSQSSFLKCKDGQRSSAICWRRTCCRAGLVIHMYLDPVVHREKVVQDRSSCTRRLPSFNVLRRAITINPKFLTGCGKVPPVKQPR